MSYADSCDYGDPLQFYAETFPIARKEHKCCECRKTIQVGEKHLYCRGKNDDFWTARQCMDCRDFCMEIRDVLMKGNGCLYFGELPEFLSEHAADIPTDTRMERKKYERIRSRFAIWKWDNEKSRKPFWKPKAFEHRSAEK